MGLWVQKHLGLRKDLQIDRIDNDGNIGNDNRIDSPGPIENSGDECEGEHCQGDDNSPEPPDDGNG